jgi:hypothetical protein
MTFTTLDVDFAADLAEARRLFKVSYDRDGRLSPDEHRAIADQHWPDWRRPTEWDDLGDFA